MAERDGAAAESLPPAAAGPITGPVTTAEPHTSSEPESAPAPVSPAAPARRRLPALLAVAVVIFIADLLTKLLVVAKLADRRPVQLIPHVLDLQLTRNPGAAFGLAAGATVLFTLVAAAVVLFIAATARRLRSLSWAGSLGLLLGGALGNLGDRLFRAPGPLRGHVVDWIHLTHWPIFNIADSSIVVGGLLAVLLSARGVRLDGKRDAEPVEPKVSPQG